MAFALTVRPQGTVALPNPPQRLRPLQMTPVAKLHQTAPALLSSFGLVGNRVFSRAGIPEAFWRLQPPLLCPPRPPARTLSPAGIGHGR